MKRQAVQFVPHGGNVLLGWSAELFGEVVTMSRTINLPSRLAEYSAIPSTIVPSIVRKPGQRWSRARSSERYFADAVAISIAAIQVHCSHPGAKRVCVTRITSDNDAIWRRHRERRQRLDKALPRHGHGGFDPGQRGRFFDPSAS
jgi:hypothetical protein